MLKQKSLSSSHFSFLFRSTLFYFLFVFSLPVLSQTEKVKFKYLTRDHGLSSSNITDILQDSDGYIWIGTEDGLNRFDGYKITVYKNNRLRKSSLSNNFVNCILEDKQHRIWIATNYGLNLYDKSKNSFTRFTYNSKTKGSISSNIIHSLYQDEKGEIWVGTNFGLNKYDNKKNNFKSFILNSNKNGEFLENKINAICEDAFHNLLLGTDGAGIKIFNKKRELFIDLAVNGELLNLDGNRITTIKKDAKNQMWIGTNGKGLFVFDSKKNTLKHFQNEPNNSKSISNNVIRSIIFDKQKNVWIGTENGGLNLRPYMKDFFLRYENDQTKPMTFSSKTAQCLLEDSQGNIWAGTHHGGINIYSPKISNFINYSKGDWNGALSYNDIRTFIETNNGEIWVGSDGGGINVFNEKTGTFTKKRFSASNSNSIGSDAIMDLMKDRNGKIYVGTWGGGLNRYNESSQSFTRFLHNPNDKTSINSNYVYVIYEDKNEVFWIGTFYGGLNTFDPKTEKFKRINYAPDGKTKFLGTYVETIHQDNQGNIWFATLDGGLNCLTNNKNTFLHYFSKTQEDLSDHVRSIYSDTKNRLWIGKTGLYLFNSKKKEFFLYSKNPYLVNEQILSIIEDKKGNLWMGTTNGLIQFNPDTKFIKRYTGADGLQGLEFCQNSAFISSKGQLFFGGFQGFNTFYPENIKAKNYNYPIHLTDLLVFNKSISQRENNSTVSKYVESGENINFSHDESVITFEYAALNYVSPQKTNYAYKLKGFDKEWNYAGTQRRATYTNLDPGDYTFYVKASSAEDLWNTKATSVNITIMPPFYQTWWFKFLVLILLSSAIFAGLHYKRQQEIRKIRQENKEALHQLQLQFFTDISHEFRTPLTLIMGTLEQVFKIGENSMLTPYFHTINRNANRLLQLISELMDFRKAEIGVLKLKVIPGNLSSFIRDIVEDFKAHAALHEFALNLHQEKEFAKVWYDRQIVEKAILNILNNAFKYTPDKGTININVVSSLKEFNSSHEHRIEIENSFTASEYVYIIISDTGVGISKNSLKHLFEPYFRVSDVKVGTGIGLAFVKRLLLIHKGKLIVNSTIGKGTEVIIAIPCNEKDYTKEEIWSKDDTDMDVQLERVQYKSKLEYSMPIKKQEQRFKFRILIVDDNDELRTFYREILESEYYVIEARDGQEGILKAKEESPTLIISDVMMPIMDGIEFCQSIKNDFETSHIPFILLTAKDALESRLQGVQSGADYYFSKPVSNDLLLLTIKNVLNQQQKIKDRYLKDYQVEVRDLVHSTKDKDFMDQLLKIIGDKLEDPELNIDYVSKEIGVSQSKLYKKIKDITGQSSNEFIRTIRLKKSMEIMTHEDVSISEVMYRVGISSNSYFTTAFKKEFGMPPSKFQKQLNKKNIN